MLSLIPSLRTRERRYPRRRQINLESMEQRLLCDAASLDIDAAHLAAEPPEFAAQNAELPDETPDTSSDPLGLTSENQAQEDAPRVFIVDAANPNAISDTTGLDRTDVTAETPLANLDALIQPSFLRDGDSIYLRSGEYVLSDPIRIDADNVLFSAYGDDTPTIRYGSFVYEWAMEVRGHGFTMDGIEMVGNVETDAGRLYSHLMLVIRGDNATIQNSVFRHNSNFLPVEEGGDIAFGNRTNPDGSPRPEAQQKWGRLVGFVDSVGNEFRNNVVVVMEADVVAKWRQNSTSIEGLRLDRSDAIVEFNQFGAAGHQMLNVANSTVAARHNTFGDVSEFEHLVDMPISDHVRVPATHTAAGFGVADGSEFSHNLLVFNTADPLDIGNGLQIQGTSNSEIFNNLFANSGGRGHAIHLGFNRISPFEIETAYNRIFHNTFVNVPTPINVAYFNGQPSEVDTTIHDNEVFNNVVFMTDANKNSIFSSVNVPMTINLAGSSAGNGNQFSNNLLFDADSETVFKTLSDGVVTSYSIDELNQLPFATGNISSAPRFADADNGDYRVTSLSPAILTVEDRQQPITDFFGNERSTDHVVLGAFGVLSDASATPVFTVLGDATYPSGTASLSIEPQNSAAQEVGNVSFHIDWNGDGQIDQIVNGPVDTVLTHKYSIAGDWTAKIDLYDDTESLLARVSHDFQTPTNNEGGDGTPPPTAPPEGTAVTIHRHSFLSIQLGISDASPSEMHEFLIDWDGDGRIDQTLRAPLGTVIQHFYPILGEYTVEVQQLGENQQPVAAFNISLHVVDDEEANNESPHILWLNPDLRSGSYLANPKS